MKIIFGNLTSNRVCVYIYMLPTHAYMHGVCMYACMSSVAAHVKLCMMCVSWLAICMPMCGVSVCVCVCVCAVCVCVQVAMHA